jgi:hypothetical protein
MSANIITKNTETGVKDMNNITNITNIIINRQEIRPAAKWPDACIGGIGVKSRWSGKTGLINWNEKPYWDDRRKTWRYVFNYGLGCTSEGRLDEKDIIK